MVEGSGIPLTKKRFSRERLFYFSFGIAAIAFLGYLSFWLFQTFLTDSQLPLRLRLPLLIFVAFPIGLIGWLVIDYRVAKAKAAVKKTGGELVMTPGMKLWARALPWFRPAFATLLFPTVAAFCFLYAPMQSGQPDARQFQIMLWIMGAIFACMSLVWPIKLSRRWLKTGSFLPIQKTPPKKSGSFSRRRRLAGGVYCIAAAAETYSAMTRTHDRTFVWVLAAFFWMAASLYLWIGFRPKKVRRLGPETPMQ